MSVYALLNILNELGKRDKMPAFSSICLCFFTTSVINQVIHELECYFYLMKLNNIKIAFFGLKHLKCLSFYTERYCRRHLVILLQNM